MKQLVKYIMMVQKNFERKCTNKFNSFTGYQSLNETKNAKNPTTIKKM